MRLVFSIIIFILIFINLESSAQTYSFNFNKKTLREVIRTIERETNYRFFLNDDHVDLNKEVKINIKDVTLDQLLDQILLQNELSYTIMENSLIVIKPIERRKYLITGKVVDKNGEPLPGVNISIKGIQYGTITNINGYYTISLKENYEKIQFSFIGFITQEISIENKRIINVILEEDNYKFDEIVVTALGIKRAEKALSYNVQKINTEGVVNNSNNNIINSLSGRIAGVQINSSAAGTGAPVKVIMRGTKSLTKNNNAMYVIDGVPMYNSNWGNESDNGYFSTQPGTESAADINKDDIEKITILTGPSAAALYGYEGSNGVILITTKKGKSNQTLITANHNTTISSPMIISKFQNKYGNNENEFESWGKETQVRYNPTEFFNNSININNNLSVSTGRDNNQTYISGASTNMSGILPNNEYNRYNFTFKNTTYFINDRLIFDVGYNYINQNNMNMVTQGQYFNPLPALYLFPRGENFNNLKTYELYDELVDIYLQFWTYGDQGLSLQNPYWIMNRMNRETKRKRHHFSIALQYNINDWLNIKGRVHDDNIDNRYMENRYAGTLSTFAGEKGYHRLDNRREQQTYADVIANIYKEIKDFNFTINIGTAIKDYRMESRNVSGNLDKITNWFTTENLDRTIGFKIKDSGMVHQSQSIFAITEVGYKNSVFLTITGRNDWDSALAFSESGDKSFFYPSVGLSCILSQMFTLPQWISFLKARASYTSVGSAYVSYITKERLEYNDQLNQYNSLSLYPNRKLKPELTKSKEAGLNIRLFKAKINVDATYYKSNTLNQTFIAKLPASSAYEGVYVQSGDIQNEGIELMLGYENKSNKIKFYSQLVYSYNKNKINKLADGVSNPVTGEKIHMPYLNKEVLGSSGSPEIRLVEKSSMGDIYVKRDWKLEENGSLHIDEKTSLPIIVDTEYRKVGSILPKSHAGLYNQISFNRISMNILINGRFGGSVVSNTQAIIDRYGVSEYSAKIREKDNTVTIRDVTIPAKDYLSIVAAGTGQGDHYIYNATNIRLGEVSIHYKLATKKFKYNKDITIGLVGTNLAMLYNKAPFDPELASSSNNIYYTGVDYFMPPSLRNIGFNLQLQF